MKTKYLILLLLFFFALSCQAQPRFSIFLNTGYAFNSSIKLNDEKVKNSEGFVFTLGGTLKLFSIKKNYLEVGVAGKTIFASGKKDGEEFSASTLRLAFPLQMNFPLSKKIEISNGFSFQNNIDLTTTDLKLGDRYLLRIDYLLNVRYLLKNNWYLTAGANLNLRNIPDAFFLNDPKFAILLGVVKCFHKKTKTKK